MSFSRDPLTEISERVPLVPPHTSQKVYYLHSGAEARSKARSTKRVRFHEVDDILASQSVSLDITFPILSHEVIVRSLWLRAAQPT